MSIGNKGRKEIFGYRLVNLISASILSVILFSVAGFLPGGGFLFYFFSILPFVYLILNYGYRIAFFSLLITYGSIYCLWGKIYALLFLLVFGSTGLFLGYGIKRKYSPSHLVILASLLCLAMLCIFEVVSFWFFHYDFFGSALDYLRVYNNKTLEFYKKIDIPSEDLKNLLSFLKEKMELIERIFFSIIILSCFLGIFILYKVAQALFVKQGYFLENLPPFSSWRPKDMLVFGFIIGGFLYWIGVYINFGFVRTLGQNILVIFLAMYFISGLSILDYFCKAYKVRKIMRYFVYMLAILQPILLIGFGLLDVWVNFRRKIKIIL